MMTLVSLCALSLSCVLAFTLICLHYLCWPGGQWPCVGEEINWMKSLKWPTSIEISKMWLVTMIWLVLTLNLWSSFKDAEILLPRLSQIVSWIRNRSSRLLLLVEKVLNTLWFLKNDGILLWPSLVILCCAI